MSHYLFEIASLMAIFSFLIVSPGADLAMVIRQSVVHGRRAAVLTSFGVGASLMFHMTYTILGLGLIISQSILLFNIVKWLGVAYLIYIGISALRAGSTDVDAIAQTASEERKAQSSIKPVFFFLSVFSGVVSHETPDSMKFVYGLVMASALIAWFVGVSFFMTTARMRALFSRMSKWIDRVSGLVFIGFGLKLATEKAG
jgi:threonine/homoserine/homoserine lactone efflux protein